MLISTLRVNGLMVSGAKAAMFTATQMSMVTCIRIVNTDSVDHQFNLWSGQRIAGVDQVIKAGETFTDDSFHEFSVGNKIEGSCTDTPSVLSYVIDVIQFTT